VGDGNLMKISKRSLIVMPDDGIQPLLKAIWKARRSIEIKVFLFSESRLVDAVIEAQKRGVKTRVMLSPPAARVNPTMT
jgi:cardiolipin synthase